MKAHEDGEERGLGDNKHKLTFNSGTEAKNADSQVHTLWLYFSKSPFGVADPFAAEVFFKLYLVPLFINRKVSYSDNSLPVSEF